MENYKQMLQQQKQALEKDIETIIEDIKVRELALETFKDRKSKAQRELRSIEKKLTKLQ